MKKTLLNFSISFLLISIPSAISILVMSILTMNNVISYSNSKLILYSISSIMFFFFSFIFSKKQKKHGFIRGLILAIFYIILTLILNSHTSTPLMLDIVRASSLFAGSIVGVNFAKN